MPRPIDHVVLPCDLTATSSLYERLGFRVGRRNRHPWGTENHIVQFPGAFLELIAPAPDFVPLPPDDAAYPFAGFLAGQTGRAHPSGMVVLRSEDARADADAYQRLGVGSGRLLDFSRDGVAPDGTVRTVAFSLAFAEAPAMPDLGFFVCQQHFPGNFWNPAVQNHPNGVKRLRGIVIVAENPSDHAEFLSGFSGQRLMSVTSMGVDIDTGGGTIEVLTPLGFGFRYGDPRGPSTEPAPLSPRLAALVFDTDEAATMPQRIEAAGLRCIENRAGWSAGSMQATTPLLVFARS